MGLWRLPLACAVWALVCGGSAPGGDRYAEALALRALPSGHVAATFRFATDAPARPHDFRLLPRGLIQALRSFHVAELRLSLTRGQWDYAQWGTGGVDPGPTGLLVGVSFAGETANASAAQQQRFDGLMQALAGAVCASVQFLRAEPSAAGGPAVGAPPYARGVVLEPQLLGWGVARPFDHIGLLSSEAVCTENLTPFLLLLPTRGKGGLGLLANPLKLFTSRYHSLGLQYERDDRTGAERLHQDIVAVMEANVFEDIRRVHTSWTLGSLLAVPSGATASPLAHSTTLELHVPRQAGEPPATWAVTGGAPTTHKTPDGTTFRWALQPSQPLDVALTWAAPPPVAPHAAPAAFPLRLHRYQTGGSGLSGTVVTHLVNEWPVPLRVTYLEAIPFSLHPLFHTLRLSSNGTGPDLLHGPIAAGAERPRLALHPAAQPTAPAGLELSLALPPHTALLVSWGFEKASLPLAWYPPDAHRGFELPGPVVTVQAPHNASWPRPVLFASSPLLVLFHTPDFSMPFNVITLTSTALALL
eukprot:EG_transcript_9575